MFLPISVLSWSKYFFFNWMLCYFKPISYELFTDLFAPFSVTQTWKKPKNGLWKLIVYDNLYSRRLPIWELSESRNDVNLPKRRYYIRLLGLVLDLIDLQFNIMFPLVVTASLKVGLSSSKTKCLIFFIERPLKMMKNAFCIILITFFVLKIFKFLSWLFGHVVKAAWLES